MDTDGSNDPRRPGEVFPHRVPPASLASTQANGRHPRRAALRAINGHDTLTPPAASPHDMPADDREPARRVRLTPASAIGMRPVRWLWTDRIPAGAITLIPGREGIGKSLFLCWLAAQLTRGQLPGQHHGSPRPVIYAATEDSWAHTIGPRLYAAGADLDMVFRVDVEHAGGRAGQLVLPLDCDALAAEITRRGVVLLAADPLLSLLDSHIDSHRDRELRTALEPLAALADASGAAVAGLAHFNKSASDDPLSLITGSRAFAAVARAVIAMAADPAADDGSCVMSQAKNNLGRLDLPSLTYTIASAEVPTPEGPALVGVLGFTGQTSRRVADILAEHHDDPDTRAERDEAADWLTAYLQAHDGQAPFSEVLTAAAADGLAKRTLQRARRRAGVIVHSEGFPRHTIWQLPDPCQAAGAPEPAGDTLAEARTALHLDVPCPHCGAGFSQACRTRTGQHISPPKVHTQRQTARQATARAAADAAREGPGGPQSRQSRQSCQPCQSPDDGATVAPPDPSPEPPAGPPAAVPDTDTLFDAIEDVIAAAHPSTAGGAELPDALTAAVEDLAAALDDASGAGPHDQLLAAAGHVLAAAGITTSPGPKDALDALRRAIPSPAIPVAP